MTHSVAQSEALGVQHVPWQDPLTRPAMSNAEDRSDRFAITNRYLEVNGVPAIPVSGELHYSRVPRRFWDERLRLMKSGGITVVACYVFWNHHEPEQGAYRFEGDFDLRAFVEACAEVGLAVVIRIGPWAHGEVRNGGFPDWVQQLPIEHRTDDPAYLTLVESWYGAIGQQLAGLIGEDGPIVGVQLENELYDQPGHLVSLKRLARAAGIHAPVWTATAWGGADLPEGEVFPLFGGYADGFWVEYSSAWDTTFREHLFFSHVWDDPGIGADIRSHVGHSSGAVVRSASHEFPPATCELGGGMVRAYHRRPDVGGLDVAAVALCKIGNGSSWQGFYMFAGGRNPHADLQESHATGYPNDLPAFDYDFNAPISATGRLRPAFAHLRRQHAFLSAFGASLATMPSTLPDERPNGVFDAETLRWALRSDGHSGFVFINRHQPYEPLQPSEPVRFALGLGDGLGDGVVEFPREPISIPAGLVAHWPVNLAVGGVTIDWATASPLTVLESGGRTTLVLTAHEGVVAQVSTATLVTGLPEGAVALDGSISFAPGVTSLVTLGEGDGELDVLVLSPADAAQAWLIDGEKRRLVFAPDGLWAGASGSLAGRASGVLLVREFDAYAGGIVPVGIEASEPIGIDVPFSVAREAGVIPAHYGEFDDRASAPSFATRDELAQRVRLELPARSTEGSELEVTWTGDVIGLLVNGVRVADQFWAGQEFVVDLSEYDLDGAVVELELLPLHPEAKVGLAPRARAIVAQWSAGAAAGSVFGGITSVRWVEDSRWSEVR